MRKSTTTPVDDETASLLNANTPTLTETTTEKMTMMMHGFRTSMCGIRREPVTLAAYAPPSGVASIVQCFPDLGKDLEDGVELWGAAYTRCISRALLDSFSVECLSHVDPCKCPTFSEWAFSWLEKYDINVENGTIFVVAPDENEDDVYEPRVAQFGQALKMHRCTSWEFYNMYELIFETLPSDAVMWFVAARYALFGGPELQSKNDYTNEHKLKKKLIIFQRRFLITFRQNSLLNHIFCYKILILT